MRVKLQTILFALYFVILDTKVILEDNENSLELTLALGDILSTKLSFNGQNTKEKAIDKTIGFYRLNQNF